jgi:hypothetical protein
MDIHAPHEPVRALRDFVIHIAIVTIGILIALSLEGLRETIHDHHLVRDARSNFRRELEIDSRNIGLELSATRKAGKDIERLASAFPGLAQTPGELDRRLDTIRNPFYFLILDSWQTALSTGALARMSSDEVEQYAGAEYKIRIYTALQNETRSAQDRAISFLRAHPNPTAADLAEGTERLFLWSRSQNSLVFVGDQTEGSINAALRRSSR